MLQTVEIPVSFGEMLDKISILEIKSERIAEPLKLSNVRRELQALRAIWSQHFPIVPDGMHDLVMCLKATNLALWDIEDAIRAQERDQDFGAGVHPPRPRGLCEKRRTCVAQARDRRAARLAVSRGKIVHFTRLSTGLRRRIL